LDIDTTVLFYLYKHSCLSVSVETDFADTSSSKIFTISENMKVRMDLKVRCNIAGHL